MDKLTVNDIDLKGKRILVRVDYNVPLDHGGSGSKVVDDSRIKATLPTLDRLIDQGARIILSAHLGRPGGRPEPKLSLRPVAAKLADLLARPVAFVDACLGEKVEKTVELLQPGDVMLLENVRFYPGEETNDADFAARLGALAEDWVNDAFGAAHRAHASTRGVAEVISRKGGSCVAGLLVERELNFLVKKLEKPESPFLVILGGAKVSDKIGVIDRLLDKADVLLIGGAMAYTFKLAKGLGVGKSLVETDRVKTARQIMEKARQRGIRFLLPSDHTVAAPTLVAPPDGKGKSVIKFDNPRYNRGADIPDDYEGVDIGLETIACYTKEIEAARTVVWNGPMGIFEDARFASGTVAVAKAVARATAQGTLSIIGGGDSVRALNEAGLAEQVSFMSTGGGASLELLEGKTLPGIEILDSLPAQAETAG